MPNIKGVMMRQVCVAAGVCLAVSTCLRPGAVSAQYAVQPADTLWYTETTQTSIEMRPPTGVVTVAATRAAEIGIAFMASEKATAWFAEMEIEQNAGDQVRRPDMAPALNRLYHLSFDRRGRVRTDTAPTFPATLASASDLPHQFMDFFISLPAESLRPGLAWVDTLRFSDGDGQSKTYVAQRIRSFHVERDTVVLGVAAFVIAVTEALSVNASEIDAQGNTITMNMTGREDGTALFAPEPGRMLRRDRSGHVSGEMKLSNGTTAITMPQRLEYSGSIVLRRFTGAAEQNVESRS